MKLKSILLPLASLIIQPALAQDAAPDPNRLPPSQDPKRVPNGLAQTPPMGWNSWNKFGCNINEATVRATADAMATNGMREAGYEYVVIDDCWHGTRDPIGFITEDRTRFPSGMKALADYIHSKGLKFGIYSDAGARTCGGRPGSLRLAARDLWAHKDLGKLAGSFRASVPPHGVVMIRLRS